MGRPFIRFRLCRPSMVTVLTLLLGSAGAQVFFSTRADYLRSKPSDPALLTPFRSSYPDTGITGLQNFAPRNFMGNIGMPTPPFLLSYGTDELGLRVFAPPYGPDRFTTRDVSFFQAAGPFASLTGIAGMKNLQIFRLFFTSNYAKKINVTLRFNRYTSAGYYVRQQTYTDNFYLTSNAAFRGGRYGYYCYLLSNGNKNQENGGLREKLTDSTMLIEKALLRARISNAQRDNRELKGMINPWFRLNKSHDSAGTDHFVQLRSRFSSTMLRYRDFNQATDTFYKVIYYDTLKTNDSTHLRTFTNELAYAVQNRKLGVSVGVRNETSEMWQHGKSHFDNNMLFADLVTRERLDTTRRMKNTTALNMQYVAWGYNQGDYKAGGSSWWQEKRRGLNFSLKAFVESRRPDLIYQRWRSNHFNWNNSFGNQRQVQAEGQLAWKGWRLWAMTQNVTGFLYYGASALPEQFKGSISNSAVQASWSGVALKHIGVSVQYLRQFTSQESIIRIPPSSGMLSLFYTGHLFRNNLHLQAGGQLQAYEPFKPYAYMPATQAFYLQDAVTTQQYPFVDVFLNARIRPVNIFLKLENLLQGLVGPGYYFVPGYYQPDFTFRCGITWMFFD